MYHIADGNKYPRKKKLKASGKFQEVRVLQRGLLSKPNHFHQGRQEGGSQPRGYLGTAEMSGAGQAVQGPRAEGALE